MSKRKFDIESELQSPSVKRVAHIQDGKKHSLDSDEEDYVDDKGVLHADDIEGEEEGVSRQEEGHRMTAFNMNEEMEEGHFDQQGHFIWKNEKEIRDNWLDNIDWHKIKNEPQNPYNLSDNLGGLGDDSDSSDSDKFEEVDNYKQMLEFMKPGETVNKALNRLGGDNKKLSSVERLKRKKAGTLTENPDVIKLTALANKNLSALGNMDIYQETFESISKKVNKKENPLEVESNMFADDFESGKKTAPTSKSNNVQDEVMWEFKWEADSNEIHGPHSSVQMLQWVKEGYFSSGVLVRKHGEKSGFYTSNRIDFDLYV